MAGPAAADTPALSVIVASLGRSSAASTVESILRSAADATAGAVDVVLVWQAAGPAPTLPTGARVIRIVPAGVSHARNVSVARSRAELLAFLDDDVVAEPSWVGSVLAAFEEGADAVCGPVQSPGDRTATDDEPGPVARWYRGRTARPWTIGDRRNVAVRRRLFDALGGFDVRMGPGTYGRSGEGVELIVGLLALGASVRWCPDMAVRAPVMSPAERTTRARRAGFGVGRVVRRRRAAAMAGAYALDLGRALVRATGAGDRAALRELSTAGRGLVAGLATGDRWTSPRGVLDRLPDGVRDALEGRRLHPWPVPHRSPLHFMWAAGADLVLHLYTDTASGFRAGRAARAAAAAAGVGGVPELVAIVGDEDAAWVLEELMPGRPGRRSWSATADWAVDLARAAGPPLGDTPWWAGAAAPLGALERLAAVPAVVVHGDLQAKNVLVDGAGALSIIDWEQATDAGPPGYDLLFLTVSAQPDEQARRAALVALAAGRDVRGTPVLSRLRAAGLDDRTLPAAIEVAVHDWAARERVRRGALGMPPQPARFAPLAATSAYSDS